MSGRIIGIIFNEGLSDQGREEALDKVRGLSGVFGAALLSPEEKKIGYAEVDAQAETAPLLEAIGAVSGVKTAHVPRPRRALTQR